MGHKANHYPHLTGDGTETWREAATCPRSHSSERKILGFQLSPVSASGTQEIWLLLSPDSVTDAVSSDKSLCLSGPPPSPLSNKLTAGGLCLLRGFPRRHPQVQFLQQSLPLTRPLWSGTGVPQPELIFLFLRAGNSGKRSQGALIPAVSPPASCLTL